MSSILEALKKSEAERTAAGSGALASAPATYRPKQRNNRVIAIALITAAIVLAAIAAGRFLLGKSGDNPRPDVIAQSSPQTLPERPPNSPTRSAVAPPDTGATPPAVKPKTPPPAAQPAQTPVADTPDASALPDDPAFVLVPDPTQADNRLPSSNGAEPTFEAINATPPPKPLTITTNTEPAQDASPPTSAPPPAETRTARATDSARLRPIERVPARAAEPTAGQPPAPGSRLPSLAQLPRLREEIGPVEMSMLVYSADPAKRFALINGQRMKQGDELAGGIKLLEIRRGECVFAANGQQFVLRNQ